MRDDLSAYIEAGGRLEGEDLNVEVVALAPGESRELDSGLRLEAFSTTHTVPAIGCHLFRKFRKLRPEFEGLAPARVAALKHSGVEISSEREELWLSYCGDSGVGVFTSEPRLFDARYLMVECTFMGSDTRELGERFGHLHLQDLVDLADRFERTTLVLYHLSRRHRRVEFEQAVARGLPSLAARVHIIAGGEIGVSQ
jgi:ribonuclease Z